LSNKHAKTRLEVLGSAPRQTPASQSLLFVHGAFTTAWCWEEHFLPFFAAAGFDARALSLSGHGNSRGREHIDSLSIADYVNDVREVVEQMPVPPILVGHSMGGFVVQKYLEHYTAPAVILMCSVPPQGLMSAAVNLLFSRPSMLSDLNRIMASNGDGIGTLRDAMFAQPISAEDMKRVFRHSQPESHRALWDMTLFNLPQPSRMADTPLLVIGAALDQLVPPSSVEMTARTYNTSAEIFPGMGHGLMLERDWRLVADRIGAWLLEQGFNPKKTVSKRAKAPVQ
jgi:pimeloyl-ACP methyl ester carboxylesterase